MSTPAPGAAAPAGNPRAGVLERVLRDFRSVAAELSGDAPAQAARARAAAQLDQLGWPSARDEQWRYANLRAFDRQEVFRPRVTAPADVAAELAALEARSPLPPPLPGFARLIYLDGVRLDRAAPPRLAALTSDAIAVAWPAEQRLGLLCDMFATEVAGFSVRGEAAIEVLFVNSLQARAAYPRLLLRLEAGSHMRLVERHLGGGAGGSLVACNIAVELARDATLSHYRLQQCDARTLFVDTLSARLEQDARYAVRSLAVGAGSARTSAHVRLGGRGAALTWQAIAVGRGEQVHDVSLSVEHAAAGTSTEEVFRGIADERARVAFSAHIRIGADAPGSQARQSLRGLIEGTSAEIDLRPRLEILTDDVRAQHGATTGRLDEDLLFYLLARGIDRATARALLKWAFLSDVLREIELPALRAEAERLAAGQLPDVPDLGALR